MILNLLFSIYFILFFLITCLPYLIITAILFLYGLCFDKKLRAVHQFSCFIAMSYFTMMPFWKLQITGKPNITKNKTYLITSNHQSLLDIALLYGVPQLFKFVSKKEVFKMPFFGWLLYFHQDVTFDRTNPNSAKKMIKDCCYWLSNGVSIMIFPEGTRGGDAQHIAEFKDGAFLTAKMAKSDILPVVINGTGLALSCGGFIKAQQTFHIAILEPLEYENYQTLKVPQVRQIVYDKMESTYQTLRQ